MYVGYRTDSSRGPHVDFVSDEKCMKRDLIWIEQDRFAGWGCSACAWVFNSTGDLPSKSFEELMVNFELQRDRAFKLHDCSDHPKPKR